MNEMENIRIVLTRNMKVLRKARKLNQEQLAEKAGLSISFLKDVERGQSWVSPESLEAIAKGLGVQVGDLFATADEEKVVQYQPVSVFAKKLLAIPDEVWEKAVELGDPESEGWKDVMGALNHAIKKKRAREEAEQAKAVASKG